MYKWRQANKWSDSIPGSDEPLLEQLPIKLIGAGPKERIDIAMGYATRYPKVCKNRYGPVMQLFTNDPELIRVCFMNSRNSRKTRLYKYFFYGNGLVTANDKIWKLHRKLINPAFGNKAVFNFIPIFNQNIINLIEKVQEFNGTEFNLLEPMIQVTLDNVCDSSIGVKIEAVKNNFPLNEYLQKIVEIVADRQLNLLYQIPFYYYFTKKKKEDDHARAWIMKFVRELISEREKVFDENINENNNNDFIEDEKTPRIMLDVLLHGHKIDGVLTRKDIEDHVLTMISAILFDILLEEETAIKYKTKPQANMTR
uniref:CSON009225 protein n=1 Tax=Culicoides sonorensis TaxID=179676 RepID=A0A336LZM6_CULSO